MQRERRKFEQQRLVLNRCAMSHAAVLSGVIQSSSLVNETLNDHAQSEMKRIRDLEEQVSRHRKEIAEYHSDFEHVQLEYNEMEASRAAVQESCNQMRSSWMFTIQQLEQGQAELVLSRSEAADLKTANIKLRNETDRLREVVLLIFIFAGMR